MKRKKDAEVASIGGVPTMPAAALVPTPSPVSAPKAAWETELPEIVVSAERVDNPNVATIGGSENATIDKTSASPVSPIVHKKVEEPETAKPQVARDVTVGIPTGIPLREPKDPKEKTERIRSGYNPLAGLGKGIAQLAAMVDFNRDERSVRSYERANERLAARESRAADRRQRDAEKAAAKDARQADREMARQARTDARLETIAARDAEREARLAREREAEAIRAEERLARNAQIDARRAERKAVAEERRDERLANRADRAEAREGAALARMEEREANRVARDAARDANILAREEERLARVGERNNRRAERAAVKEENAIERAENRQLREEQATARRDAREASIAERKADRTERKAEQEAIAAERRADRAIARAERNAERQAIADARREERLNDRERELRGLDTLGVRPATAKMAGLDVTPSAASVDQNKIDESKMPELELNVDLDDVVVDGTDKRKPLDLGISPVQSEIDQSKAREIPIEVHAPSKQKEIYDYTAYQRDKIFNDTFDEGRRGNAPIHNDVDIIDSTLEEEELPADSKEAVEDVAEEAKKADDPLAFLTQLASQYSDEDRKADEKRKKAAQWILAAQMLGDSIGALSNVYWTGKGANAMKFEPGAQKAATATYQLEKDIREAREKAAKAQYDATLKKYELEMDKAKADREKADADRRHEENVRHNKATEEISRLSAENAAKSANTAMYNAETSRMNAATASRNASVNEAEERRKAEQYNKQHGDRKFLIGDQWVNIPKDRWEGVVGSIYNSLPEEVRKVYETQVTDEFGIRKETRKAPTIAVMDAAVRQYAQDPVVMDAILKAAGVKVEEVNPKKEEREKENTPTNNTEPPIQAYSAPADERSSQWRRRAGLDTTDFSQFKRK